MRRSSFFYTLIILISTTLASCGGGGGTSAGIGGTGITSSGAITSIGSIYVNGVRYDVDNATVTVNDGSSTPAALKVGMVVTVTGELDSAGSTTGTAHTVVYDNEIQGPVTGLTDLNGDGLIKRFTIMGQTVDASGTATAFEDDGGANYDFSMLADGDTVEVSGFVDQNSVLQASRIEKKTGSEVELKGVVTGYNPTGGAVSMGSFMLGSITVEITGTTDLSDLPGATISEGMQVEVKGDLSGSIITASKIELDDDGLGDDVDNVSLEGIVSGFTDINSTFFVAGQQVDASTASMEPANLTLTDGAKVEVEGDIVNGVLIADEIEARSGEVKLHATVSTVSSSTITMGYFAGTVDVLVDNKTSFKDGLTFQTIAVGDFLEVEGYQDGGGNVIASEVKPRSTLEKDLLQGPVDGPLSGGSAISVLGLQYSLIVGITAFADDQEMALTNAQFFNILNVGDTVKIEDDQPSDGVADEVELE